MLFAKLIAFIILTIFCGFFKMFWEKYTNLGSQFLLDLFPVGAYLISYMKRPLFTVCLCIVVLFGILYLAGVLKSPASKLSLMIPDKSPVNVTGRIRDRNTDWVTIDRLCFTDSEGKSNKYPGCSLLIKRDELEGHVPLSLGLTLHVRGSFRHFKEASNPGEFDLAGYYYEKGMAGNLTDISKVYPSGKPGVIRENLLKLKELWEARLHKVFPDIEASVLCDLLLGDRTGLDDGIKDLYTRNGIAHILSISALHVSILGMGLYRLLRRIGLPLPAACVISGIFLISYGAMTGMSISSKRAIGMFLLVLIADLIGRTPDTLTSLSLVAVIILISDPCSIGSCGFLLSFGSVAGIVCLAPVLKKEIGKIKIPAFSVRPARKVITFLSDSFAVSISVCLTTLPVVLWFFYETPVYSAFLNLIILPFMSVVMVSGILAMVLYGFGIVGTPAYFVLKFYELMCRGFDRLPFHTWNPGRPQVWAIVIYYAVWLLIVFMPKIRIISGRKALPVVLPLIILPLLMAFPRIPRNTVLMLDVGQGDGLIYYTDAGEVFLFDGGSSSNERLGEYVLKPALKYYGFSRINAAFISHPDTDHLSGITEIVQNRDEWGFRIEKILLPVCRLTLYEENMLTDGDLSKLLTGGYHMQDGRNDLGLHNFMNLVTLSSDSSYKASVPIEYISAGASFKSGRNEFFCLHPSEDFSPSDSNEMSECFFVRFFGSEKDSPTLLLTGDIHGQGETDMRASLARAASEGLAPSPAIPVTILKVAHHGSRNSTADEFLRGLFPTVSLISAGRSNRYGHPHTETLERLKDKGSEVLCTSESGAIMINIKKDRLVIKTFFK